MSMRDRVTVSVDVDRIRKNAESILRLTGVPVIAVVKANAYGLGVIRVAEAIGDLVQGFYVFHSTEAVTGRLWEITKKRTIALHGDWNDPHEYSRHHIQPVVWTVERAAALRLARPILSIDTGQQRFACSPELTRSVQAAGDIHEAMTHAINTTQVERFKAAVSTLAGEGLFTHAAGSALLQDPTSYLNAVRPGLALYQGAVTVSAPLIEVRDGNGPAGYTGFTTPRFGVIPAGYSDGLRPGPCSVNGAIRQILEVGMQSAFVEAGPTDRRGDDVILLGENADINETRIAKTWNCSPQEVLVRLTHRSPA